MFRFCSYFLIVSVLAAEPAAEPADWIWSARFVITENPQRRVIENGAVAIRAGRIVGVRQERRSTRASGPSGGWTARTPFWRPA